MTLEDYNRTPYILSSDEEVQRIVAAGYHPVEHGDYLLFFKWRNRARHNDIGGFWRMSTRYLAIPKDASKRRPTYNFATIACVFEGTEDEKETDRLNGSLMENDRLIALYNADLDVVGISYFSRAR